jgi:peptidoglycan-N-acetylglucosamine deacetylase
MSTKSAAAAVLFLASACLAPAAAGEACSERSDVLGVARTIEIDTSAGPRFASRDGGQALLADGEVVLTFDDGPLRVHTRRVLDALAAQCTRATFFLVGSMALADPDWAREYARRGHTVASHTWSHANLGALSQEKGIAEMELGLSAVRLATGGPVAPFFRFPYLRETPGMLAHLKERQFAEFGIDIDSKDYATHDPNAVRRRVLTELARRHRGIILFHDIQASTAHALPLLLADLKTRGYHVVHLLAKQEATTLADFDALAAQEFEKRHKTATGERPSGGRWPSSHPPVHSATVRRGAPDAEPLPRAHARTPTSPDGSGWTTSIWR